MGGQQSGTVDTNEKFYKPFGIKYKGLKLLDVPQTNIALHFNEVVQFIEEGLENGGKVLVNCQMGVSRSSAAVIALPPFLPSHIPPFLLSHIPPFLLYHMPPFLLSHIPP